MLGKQGLLARLQKSLLERALELELTQQLGWGRHEAAGRGSGSKSWNATRWRDFRVEFFPAFDSPTFGTLQDVFSRSNFGQVIGTPVRERNIQLGPSMRI